jgi:hypothetical protein
MAKLILLLTVALVSEAHAQLFQNPFSNKTTTPAGNALVRALDELDKLELGTSFEERYRTLSLEIERQLDLRRSDCLEIPQKSERERCFRDIVTEQKRYIERGFVLRKDYLQRIHGQQLKALDDARAKALSELERQF